MSWFTMTSCCPCATIGATTEEDELTNQPEIQMKSPLSKHPKQPFASIIPKAPRDGESSSSPIPRSMLHLDRCHKEARDRI